MRRFEIGRLVVGEIDPGRTVQRLQHRLDFVALGDLSLLDGVPQRERILAHQGNPLTDFRGSKHEVDVSQPDRGLRHAVKSGRLRILGEGDAAGRLDRRNSQRAIRAITRQHHPNRLVGAIVGQRAKKRIDRHVSGGASAYPQHAIFYRKIGVGRDDVDVIGLDRRLVGSLAHRELRIAGKNLAEHALVGGVQMLNEDHRDPAILGQRAQQFGECFQAAGRRADADDREPRKSRRSFRHPRRSTDKWRLMPLCSDG